MATSKKKAGKRPPVYPDADVYTLSNLDQVRILADPLRVRILEALCEERTTKQVAERIGEKPTKLYHHVEALEKVGLVRMTRTRQNRGTLEKYFLAVARSFRTDPTLFSSITPGGAQSEALEAITATAFDNTAAELRELIALGETDLEADGAICYAEVRASPKKVKQMQARIEELLADIVKVDEAEEEEDEDDDGEQETLRYRLTLAFFPLDGKGASK